VKIPSDATLTGAPAASAAGRAKVATGSAADEIEVGRETGLGEGDTVGEGDGVGLTDGEGEGVGLTDGAGERAGATSGPLISPLTPQPASATTSRLESRRAIASGVRK